MGPDAGAAPLEVVPVRVVDDGAVVVVGLIDVLDGPAEVGGTVLVTWPPLPPSCPAPTEILGRLFLPSARNLSADLYLPRGFLPFGWFGHEPAVQ